MSNSATSFVLAQGAGSGIGLWGRVGEVVDGVGVWGVLGSPRVETLGGGDPRAYSTPVHAGWWT